ncbi:ABC transporter permease [Candidatus Micrarchaeota archaeon]|nr:ABC transporter permease [Candidatus Micrarchaeota archaeon]
MNLRSEIEKDGKQFFREGRTLVLLFAAPIIVLLILGGVFGRTSIDIGGTAIGLCDLDNSAVSNLFVSGITNSTKIMDYSNETDCSLVVEREVREGRLAAALVIPAGFGTGITEGESQNLTVFLDNSRIQTAPSIEAFMKAAVQETGQEIGTEFILTVWGRLDEAGAQLEDLLEGVSDTRERAQEMQIQLSETSDSLNAINITVVESELNAANSTVEAALSSLEDAESNLTVIESRFAGYDAELNQSESDLMEINRTLANASGYIAAAKSGMNCSDPLFIAYCFSLDSLGSQIDSAKASVEDRLTKIRNARASLSEANATIQDFKANIADAKNGASDAEARIANMQDFVYGLAKSKREALVTIAEINSSLVELVEKSYELEDIILESRKQITEITSTDPQSVVSPILLSSNYLFGSRTFFDFLLPSLLPMILMFISLFLSSTSLVREKNSGTLGRVGLSQINPIEYTATKVLSYTVVLIPEAILLTIVAAMVYSAFPLFDIGTVIFVFESLVLLILAFTAIGVLIAIFSESEATAFLASLVVGLPLLFLSGLVFPFEFMPSTIAMLGYASPLTQGVFSMQSLILYHSPQPVGFGVLLLYAIVFTLVAAFSMKKIR